MGTIIKKASEIMTFNNKDNKNNKLYLSGETSARDKSLLLSLSVSAVVNVTKELAFFHEGFYF